MAEEITLRAYIERIESMIREGRMDEAIAHSAHILQFHPKDAVVYRNMGRALMRLQRYEEASEIFRRLLAAVPDDFSSHYQLSIVYENENKGEAAIWHIERAFDQQPNNAQVNDRLRELYKKFKQVDVDKIQLTAGAVALQYYKAGMYNEAITLLQRTLLKVPDRADLLTLLARTQWERGDVVDAAETSLDLLKTYPYALEANRILSQLWLHEERPSDAQRYLSRVEDIDPYLAYEIATNDDVPDEQFIIEELDFSRYAASLASLEQAPDWLANIEELTESERKAQEATPIDDLTFDTDDDIAVAEDNDWLNDLHDNSQPIDPVKKKVTDDLSDLLPDDFSFPDSAGTDDTVDTSELSNLALLEELETDNGFDDLFDDLDDLDTSGTGLTGLLGDDEDEGTGLTGLLGEDSASSVGLTGMLRKLDSEDADENPQTDDLSWLDEVSAGNYGADNLNEINDADEDFFAEMADADDSTDKDDALAWLSTDNLISKEVDDSDELSTDNLSEAVVDPNDPMAWLQSSGIDFDDDVDDNAGFFIEDDPVSIQSDNLDPMAWLADDIADADDDFVLDTNNLDNDAPDSAQDDPMAWLTDDGIDFLEDDSAEATDDLELDESMSWLTESDATNEPDYYETVDTNEILTGQLGNLDDYVPDDSEDDSLEWLTDDEPESSTNDDWLTDDSVLDDLLNIADLTNSDVVDEDNLFINTEMQDSMTEQPDWTPDDDFNSDNDLGWLENEDLDAQDSLEAEDDSMAWLAQDKNIIEAEDDSMAWLADEDENIIEAEDDSMAWLADEDENTIEAEDDSMAWLDDEDENTIEAEDDSMAWLAQDENIIEAEDDSMAWLDDEDENTIEAEDDPMAWLDDEDPIGDDLPQAKAGTSLLNFLNDDHDIEIGDDFDMLTEEEAFADEGMDWLKTLDGEEVEEIEETVLTTDSDFDTTADNDVIWDVDDASGGDDFDWGDDEGEAELDWTLESSDETDDFPLDFEDDDELTDDAIAEPASEDWLAEFGDNDMTDEPEEEWTANSDFPDEFDDDNSSEDEALEADWLADFELSDDDVSDDFDDDPIADPAEADWLADITADDDSDDLVAEDTDWLTEPETEQQDWAVGSGFTDELSDDDDNDDLAEADWLADITADDDDEDSDDFVAEDTNWLSEPETDDVEEDWAVGSGFTDELSDEPEEDWLSEVGVVEEDEWSDEDYDSEFEGEYDLNASTDGMSDMLDTIRTSRDEPTDFETTVDGFDGDEPEWLKQTGEYLAPEQNEEVDWGDDDSDYLEVLPLADIEPDDYDEDDDSEEVAYADADNTLDWLDEDDADEDSVPDWLDTDEVEDEEAIPLAEFDTDDDYDEVFEASSSDSTYLDDYDEDTEQADADNAPDWLNAMVPGLDLDFEAEDEGHLDEGFEERENTLRERRLNESETIKSDFDWLQDIVEEETGVMDAVNDEDMATTPPPTPLAPRKQYEFSLPPVWARDGNATDSIAQAVTLASEVPDYLSDFDDFDETPDYDSDDDLNDEFQFESEEIVTVDDELSLSDEDDTVNFEADNDGIDDEPEFVVGDQSFDFDDVDNMIDDSLDTIEDELDFVDDEQSFDFDTVDNMIDDSLDTIEDELDFVDDEQSFDFDTVDNMIDDSLDTIEDELDFVVGDQSFDFDDVDNMIDDKLDTDDFSKFDDEFDEFDDDEFDDDDDFDDEFDEFDDDEFDD
ncbi:MAG: hypothetical protein Phog2KO_29270 [Phototrophicaceae bacterium]